MNSQKIHRFWKENRVSYKETWVSALKDILLRVQNYKKGQISISTEKVVIEINTEHS